MLIDLLARAPRLLLAAGVAAFAAFIVRLVAHQVERARRSRHYGGWRVLQERPHRPPPFVTRP
jgi:hypothetical protein